VSGTGKNGIEIQLPSVMSAINAAEYDIIAALCIFPNIVNHKKLCG
jgi:hypothetical protein